MPWTTVASSHWTACGGWLSLRTTATASSPRGSSSGTSASPTRCSRSCGGGSQGTQWPPTLGPPRRLNSCSEAWTASAPPPSTWTGCSASSSTSSASRVISTTLPPPCAPSAGGAPHSTTSAPSSSSSEPWPWDISTRTDVVYSAAYKVITYSLLLVLVLVEAWEIVAGVCSIWTKMALLGHYLGHQSMWRRSSCLHAALAAVLKLRPVRRRRDKLGHHSLLEPRRFRRRMGLLSELLYGSSGLMKSIQVSPVVRDAVLRSLRSSYGRQSAGGAAARPVGGGGKVGWAHKSWTPDYGDGGNSCTELILMWHVGTRLFEMKSTSSSPDMIAACHLSYYCAYLVAVAPELLPDCAAWTKRRYKEVSDDVMSAAAALGSESMAMAERYEQMVQALSKGSRDTVLRRGAELGRHLVEDYVDDEATACRILADYWSEMVLYVAPSENVKGHVQAMARGGEFITIVWALLLHAGVTTRPETLPGSATAATP
ncbi:hypothetical protein BS78_03G141300 [Paspalum vaginatum]|nr:hypothetical protein BS78_03G141300 [Paspalum vaginatum]